MKDFTKYNYQTLVDKMTDLLKDAEGWGEGYQSSIGQTLIQLMADTTDALHYMLERRTQENFINTAFLESSIRARASAIGYRPRRKVSASGILLLELIDDNGAAVNAIGDIKIPKGTRVFLDDLEFTVIEDSEIIGGQNQVELQVKEGKFISEIFNFEDEPYKSTRTVEYPDYISKEEFSITVVGDDGEFYDVTTYNDASIGSLSFAFPSDMVYDIKYTADGMRIVFGDGTFGFKPEGNIQISWIESAGADVDIITTGLEFEFESDVLEDDANTIPKNLYKYRLTNTTSIRGAKDEETVEEIRRNAPEFLRSNNRAVTPFDYEFWVRRSGLGGIVDSNCYGEQELRKLLFTMNNVYIAYVTEDGLPMNPEQETELREYLDVRKNVTVHLIFKYADRIYLGLGVKFRRERQLPISDEQLYKILVSAIEEYMKVQEGSIGKSFIHSEFVCFLQDYEFEFNGITYDLADYVKVTVDGLFPFTVPCDSYDVKIKLLPTYIPEDGDQWRIKVDGTVYYINIQQGETLESIVDRMEDFLRSNLNANVERFDDLTIRIRKYDNSEYFSYSIEDDVVTLMDYTYTSIRLDLNPVNATYKVYGQPTGPFIYTELNGKIQIPKQDHINITGADQLLRGTVEIIDEEHRVIMRDNEEGLMEPIYPFVVNPVEVDYVNCTIEQPVLDEGQYYVRFQQNVYQNFHVAFDGVIEMMPFKEEIDSPDNFEFSKLDLI